MNMPRGNDGAYFDIKETRMNYRNNFKRALCILPVLLIMLSAGCKSDKPVVLTAGLKDNQIFQIDKSFGLRPEVMVYLTNIQNTYEKVYGPEIWNTSTDEAPLEESLKDTVLARISRVKVMTLLAKRENVTLTNNQKTQVSNAANEYYASLNDTEKELLGIDRDTIEAMYTDMALADAVYEHLISDVNPEISDDEARTITVSHILIKTYHTDLKGNVTKFSESLKADAYERAKNVKKLLDEGEDFDTLVITYNEDSQSVYSFRRGQTDEDYEAVAFELANDEISDIVETKYGYYIIKCISTSDKTQTESNKEEILKERRDAVFNSEYENFLGTLVGQLNEEKWNEISLIHDPNVTTSDFFDIYDKYFISTQ